MRWTRFVAWGGRGFRGESPQACSGVASPGSAAPSTLAVIATLAAQVLLAISVTACGTTGGGGTSLEADRRIALSELEVVDCIVEGAVRQMGRSFTYQEPPRMARLTAFECASLGGTFVAYDPANPNAVIERWLEPAESGNVDAQHRLGLLYEGVMGAEPDYAKAAKWYAEAARAGHRESMYALSVLYEKGLGVEQDIVRALELYRQASGINDDSLMLSSEAYRQIDTLKESLAEEIAALDMQRKTLEEQVERLTREKGASDRENRERIAALTALAEQLGGQVSQKETQIAALPSYRLVDPRGPKRADEFDFPPLPANVMRKKSIGRYFALVIGNNAYESLPDLQTPRSDAKRIAELLSDRFGFSTQLLLDANEEDLKRAIHKLSRTAGKDDNVLIYFAGHGELRAAVERSRLLGFWLPTNADEDQDVNWVDNWWVTNHLDTAAAKRALVVADTCYGGVFSTDLPIGPVAELPALSERDLDKKLQRKGRFVLASGGTEPVLDTTGPDSQHSVFANAFIEILESSTGPMSVIELYGRIFDRMYERLTLLGLTQEPELRVIRAAGHESEGDFFFVAKEGL